MLSEVSHAVRTYMGEISNAKVNVKIKLVARAPLTLRAINLLLQNIHKPMGITKSDTRVNVIPQIPNSAILNFLAIITINIIDAANLYNDAV